MRYELLVMGDGTVIDHSEFRDDGTIDVYIENKRYSDNTMICHIPSYRLENSVSYPYEFKEKTVKFIKGISDTIVKCSKCGGFDNIK